MGMLPGMSEYSENTAVKSVSSRYTRRRKTLYPFTAGTGASQLSVTPLAAATAARFVGL